jgi:hypothetical protein
VQQIFILTILFKTSFKDCPEKLESCVPKSIILKGYKQKMVKEVKKLIKK